MLWRMDRYFRLSADYYLDHGITSGPTLPDGSVMAGQRVEADSLPELVYQIDVPDNDSCPHFLTDGTVIASGLFIDTLRDAGAHNVQQFPARLFNPASGKQRDNFFLFNVLGMYRAADLRRSSFDPLIAADPDDAPLVALREVVLDAARLPALRIFRLAEDPTVLVIDEALKAALARHRPVGGWGIMFEELEVG